MPSDLQPEPYITAGEMRGRPLPTEMKAVLSVCGVLCLLALCAAGKAEGVSLSRVFKMVSVIRSGFL